MINENISTPIFPPLGPATGSFNGLQPKSNSLQIVKAMKTKSLLCLFALPLLLCGGSDAKDKKSKLPCYYDAVNDFSPTRNPNGAWKYGWSDGLSGRFILFSSSSRPVYRPIEWGWYDPKNSANFTPKVTLNTGGDFDDGNVTFSAGALLLHPCGTNSRSYSHVVWTAPEKGTYFLTTIFYAQQNLIDVDVHILINGVSVFEDTITRNSIIRTFSNGYKFSRGDTIDFTVGPNGNFEHHAGDTGLQAIILPQR